MVFLIVQIIYCTMLFSNVMGPSRGAERDAKYQLILKLQPGVDEYEFVNENQTVSALGLITPDMWKCGTKTMIVQIADTFHIPEGTGRAIILPFDLHEPESKPILIYIDDFVNNPLFYNSRIDHAEEVLTARCNLLRRLKKHSTMFLDFNVNKSFPVINTIQSIVPEPRSPKYSALSPKYSALSPKYSALSPKFNAQ